MFTVFSVQEALQRRIAHSAIGRKCFKISLFFWMVANRTVNDWMDNPIEGIIACFSQEMEVIRFYNLIFHESIHPACPYCFLQIKNQVSFAITTPLAFYQVPLRSIC